MTARKHVSYKNLASKSEENVSKIVLKIVYLYIPYLLYYLLTKETCFSLFRGCNTISPPSDFVSPTDENTCRQTKVYNSHTDKNSKQICLKQSKRHRARSNNPFQSANCVFYP